MGVSVIYTVAYIIVSPRFQFFSNKNIGNVVLFALQTNHLDSVFNIFINPEDSETETCAKRPFRRRRLSRRRPDSSPGSLCPAARPCGQVALTGYLFFRSRLARGVAP